MPITPDAMAPAAIPAPPIQQPVVPQYRDFLDVQSQRDYINDSVVQALQGVQHQNNDYTLRLANVNPQFKKFTKKDEKKAIGEKGYLHHKVKGTWELVDKTGNVVDRKNSTVAYIPHVTDRGTFVNRGTNYVVAHQTRLRPGIYTRKQQNGHVESQFNIKPGSGKGFRIRLDPETGRFKVRVGQGESNLYPLLKAAGVEDKDLAGIWGAKLLQANMGEDRNRADLKKTLGRLGLNPENVQDSELDDAALELISSMEVDPETTEMTLGQKVEKLSPMVLAQATRKMLSVARGEDDGDDRDSLAFQSVHGPEDFFAERIKRDVASNVRKHLWNATRSGSLEKMPSGVYRDSLYGIFNGTGLAQVVEETNPVEVADLRMKLTRMGEGAMRSTEASPRGARGVQPSHMGFIDPIRTPESQKIGLDMRAAWNTFKGRDNKLYSAVINKAGKTEVVSATDMLKGIIGFPGEREREDGRARAMVHGKIREVPKSAVKYWVQSPEEQYSPTTSMVVGHSGSKAQRALMGARMTTQAMPLVDREAPFVQAAAPGINKTFDALVGEHTGAVRAPAQGVVTAVTKDTITLKTPTGDQTIDLYDELPMNRLSNLRQAPMVEVGQQVGEGDVLATSNFTDEEGAVALGRNLRVGYLAHGGSTFEDAVVVSESAAKKMAAEASLKFEREKGENTHATQPQDFRSLFPGKFSVDQFKKLDKNGVVRKGQTVYEGDPLLLQVNKTKRQGIGAIMRGDKSRFKDDSQVWDHHYPGEVVDVFKRKNGDTKVVVRATLPAQVGDKLSGRYGDKGVISKIIPDAQMPRSGDNPLDILVSPYGINSRANPVQLVEAALGKVAEATGKRYSLRNFREKGVESLVEEAWNALQDSGLSDTEQVYDPAEDRTIDDVFVGNRYYMRLHHLAEKKLSARDTDSYTSDDTPAKGGPSGAKRISLGETAALLSTGATEILRDAKLVRGQRNDDYWRAIQLGYTPSMPTDSVASKKFMETLKAAGVNVAGRGDNLYVMPMTSRDIDKLTEGREISKAQTFNWDTMEPVKGGLFDLAATGGSDGTQWSAFKLPQPVLNPLMQDPVQKILGLSEKNMREVMAGRQKLGTQTGPRAIQNALQVVDKRLDKEIEATKQQIITGSKSKRDAAVKRLAYLTSFQKMEINPSDLMLTKVPVLPPKYRPISNTDTTMLIADPNYLYADMIAASDNLEQAEQVFGEGGDAYLGLYDGVKAVVGLGKPISEKLREKKVTGLLAQAVGIGRSPKTAQFQRRIVGTSVDQVGRGVIAPDPKLDIDQIGVPEEMAWTNYRKYIVRKLVQRGMPAAQAVASVADRDATAKKTLLEVMEERPVFLNRAPTLHRHSIIGGRPVLVKGDTIMLSPPVEAGLGADHDGDAVQIHVPSTDGAIKDVYEKLLPSQNLRTPANFKVHMKPENEFLHGLYRAVKAKKKPPRKFANKDDLIAAYKRGDIGINDPVIIGS